VNAWSRAVRIDDELGEGYSSQRIAGPESEGSHRARFARSPVEGECTNWPPPASPDTGYFYVNEHNSFNIVYDGHGPAWLDGVGQTDASAVAAPPEISGGD
jgi:hypothetical protein